MHASVAVVVVYNFVVYVDIESVVNSAAVVVAAAVVDAASAAVVNTAIVVVFVDIESVVANTVIILAIAAVAVVFQLLLLRIRDAVFDIVVVDVDIDPLFSNCLVQFP